MNNTTATTPSDPFGPRATLYSRSRPTYPPSLVQQLFVSYCQDTKLTVLDVAAGSGQLSELLTEDPRVHHLVAIDKSERQLAQSNKKKNVTYQLGDATDLPSCTCSDGTNNNLQWDVITCAQAYHWFVADGIDQEFLKQVHQKLHPDHGRLGIFGYGICSIVSHPKLEAIFKDFYYQKLGSHLPPSSPDCYWDMDRRFLDSGLQGMSTYGLLELLQRYDQVERKQMTRQQFLNYIRTFSALANLQKQSALKGDMDPMEMLHNQFEGDDDDDDDQILEVEFPFFLLILKPVHDKNKKMEKE